MDQIGDLLHFPFEQPAGVRVGQHDAGNIALVFGNGLLQGLQIDGAVILGIDVDHLVAQERCRCRVGAMGTFRHQHDLRIAAGCRVGRLDRHHAAQFAVGTGLRAHRDSGGVGRHHQPVGKRIDQFQRARHGGDRLQRVDVCEARQASHFFVETRIVLHGARAERIKAAVDGVVVPRQAHVMAHGFRFGETRQADLGGTPEAAKLELGAFILVQVDACGFQ